jgi:Mn2+/Fe2+ NRAMP family transporter
MNEHPSHREKSEPIKGPPADTQGLPKDGGAMDYWNVDELPAPPPFGFRNVFKVIGPGAIMAATSIGGGEWLVGPATAVSYGTSIFLIVTVAIVLQVVFNLEAIRYTLYTGEPIYGGIMRLKPGSRPWAVFYSILGFCQLGLPALAGTAAGALLSAMLGRLPSELDGSPDRTMQIWLTLGVLLLVVLILSFGGTIERMLEKFSWVMLGMVFSFLMVLNLVFVPFSHWWETFLGFFKFTGLPEPIDWALIGGLAATAGSGGMGNLTVSNWIRDKGFGMGAKVGAIPSAVAGHEIQLSHIGSVFRVNETSVKRWREWMRYVTVDQVWVWGCFCFVGMYLNVNLASHLIPHGTDLQKIGAGSYQAAYLRKLWEPLWFLTLFNGFWILFKTQLGNTDILVRTVTDVMWMSSRRVRAWKGGRIHWVYYSILGIFTAWGFLSVNLATPMTLFKILANVAGLVLAIAGLQILRVNRRFLPRELRPPWWREAMLIACVIFYGFFSIVVFRSVLQKL